MKNTFTSLLCAVLTFAAYSLNAQSYTSFLTGSPDDLEVQAQFGICLMGGGGESDEAMTWFLERANGGDVVVIRTSGSDGYNNYMFSELGVTLNSVETILFHGAEAATDPYVVERLNNAEAIWMAGGNQATYVNMWKDTPVQEAINNLLNVKGGVVGGISAGMAVMGQAYFPALAGSITSESALNNPLAPSFILGYDDFVEAPFLENVITETHLNDPARLRYGRVTAFMARVWHDFGVRPLGIAANEYCAVAIDENGLARVFGEFPAFDDDYVYFLQDNCISSIGPEIIESGQPITWLRDEQAVKVYKVPATTAGENTFDLNDWNTGSGGVWEDWYVLEGELSRVEDAEASECNLTLRSSQHFDFSLFPNPAREQMVLRTDWEQYEYHVFDLTGRLVVQGSSRSQEARIDIGHLARGLYKIAVIGPDGNFSASFVKQE